VPLYLLLGGGALLGSGIVLFSHARYRYDSADCPNNSCTGEPHDARVAAKKEAIVSYVLAGAGAALGGVGLILNLSSSNRSGAKAGAVIRVNAALSGVSVSAPF
jgi:hypothetical protein